MCRPILRSPTRDLVAPEFQITGETSVAGYTNFMQGVISAGVGVQSRCACRLYAELAVADNTDALIDRVNRCLDALAQWERSNCQDDPRCRQRDIGHGSTNGRANRVYTAVLLTMASPEYLVQK